MLPLHHSIRRFFWILLCLLLVLVISPKPHQALPRAEAATFTVTNTNDSGAGSLRQAIIDANGSAGADVINFSVAGTITLGSQLDVTGDLTINGGGITLNGNNATRIMGVGSGATVVLNNLSFQSGSDPMGAGGAIINNIGGTLTITNSTFIVNQAGFGGAIVNDGTLTITTSTFTDNLSFGNRGAIANSGTLTITSSTFKDNRALGSGGAIGNGGIVVITNSTFSGNTAVAGGAIFSFGTVTITSSSFSGNTDSSGGGALYLSNGTINVASSLIVDGNCFGALTDGGHNLSFNAAGCPAPGADPQLGPLQNNGGPTHTILPALTGPAVDAYPAPCATTTDQRGIARPQGPQCDIGATEQNGSVALVASAACVDENLAVTISAGDGPFNITASAGINMPVNGVSTGTTTINGPEKWDDVTVTETSGDLQSINLGTFKCRSADKPTPLTPAHQAHTTNPFPLFSWTAITDANNYRVFVFDDANPATRTVDIRQNSGGPTSMTLTTPLPNGRLFWRVRGRQNRL
ncbi:MAG: hypothetical protein L0154_17675, partial [Chloroflexi bacterium]|nr:hypothetical protein [Chloroflexota bacterium]